MRKMLVAVCVASLVPFMAVAQTPNPAATTFADGRGSINVDALAMWFKASPTPVPIITDDFYGMPGTHVLWGGGRLDSYANPGFRISGMFALDGGRASSPTVHAGYSLRYASNAARPAQQIERNINPSYNLANGGGPPPVTPVGSAEPTFDFNSSDFRRKT